MDSKEIKATLKNAREAIRVKDYKEALRQCKNILKHDKDNYNAWVFIGVAALGMDQTDQAIMAYRRAIDITPSQILAWQGICDLYEKDNSGKYQAELVNTYEQLIKFYESDEAKKNDVMMKLAELYNMTNQKDKSLDLYRKLTSEPSQHRNNAYRKLIATLSAYKTLTNEDWQQLEAAYKGLLSELKDAPEMVDVWTSFIDLLRKRSRDSEKLMQSCEDMMRDCVTAAYPAEVMCLLLVDAYIKGENEIETKMYEACEKLRSLDESSHVLKLVGGCLKFICKDYLQACKLLAQGLEAFPNLVSGWVLLARCQCMLHNRPGCLESIKQGLQKLQQKDRELTIEASVVTFKLQLIHLDTLSEGQGQQMLCSALELADKLLIDKNEDKNLLIEAVEIHLKLFEIVKENKKEKHLEEAIRICKQLGNNYPKDRDVLALNGWCLYHQGDLVKGQESLEEVVSHNTSTAKNHYWLARILWSKLAEDKSLRSKFINTMLQAAKLDPYHSNSFLYLGHYYSTVLHDNEKARRCYQKAFDLDPENEAAGMALVDISASTGNAEKGHEILLQVTSQAVPGGVKWAWLRLGLHQLHHDGDPSRAITSLQCALRADPDDVNCWECLAEGYMTRGSYTAALKAFTRASQLTDDNLYSLYQIATIKHTLCEYTEAVEDYKSVLQKRPDYVPALTGIGTTHLALARASLSQCFHGRAVDHCQAAIDHLTRAATQRADLSCVWKLMGDACSVLHNLDDNLVRMTVPSKLLTNDQKAEKQCMLGKSDILALGTRCYGHCLKLVPESGSIWHDLGLSYFYQSEHSEEGVPKQTFAETAIKAIKQAITLEPSNHLYWNTLGVITASKVSHDAALSQHCFIKSTQLESNNAMAWTNLGILYMKHDNIKLAHEAFKMAQALEPSYVTSWIGQALIAETVGHEEAMDLFRHATELANHTEGSLGYGYWVCHTLRNVSNRKTDYFLYAIEQMAAVPMACDALARYTDRIRGDSTAWNLYGLLLERQGLYQLALKAFKRSITTVSNEDKEVLNKVRANIARVMCRSGLYAESVEQYLTISPLADFEDICGMALAQYKLGNLKESYQAYEQALELTSSDEDRSHIHTALAMVLYKHQDVDAAKSSLFKASQMSAPSVSGLLALCSLGLIQGDMTLAAAVLAELQKTGHQVHNQKHVAFIHSLYHYLMGDSVQSRNQICKAIHKHPECSSLWKLLSKNLQNVTVGGAKVAPVCCRIASHAKHDQQEVSRLYAVSLLNAGTTPSPQNNKHTFNAAKKAVHLFPDKLQNWCVLIAAAKVYQVTSVLQSCKDPAVNTVSLSSHLLNQAETAMDQDSSESALLLHKWCLKQYVVSMLYSRRQKEALQYLAMVAKVFSSRHDLVPSLDVLLAFIEEDSEKMKSLINTGDMTATIMLLVELLVCEGRGAEAVLLLHDRLSNCSSRSEKQHVLVQLAFIALFLMKKDKDPKWDQLCSEAVRESLDLDPMCSAAYFLQGSLAFHQSNNRLLRRSLEKLLQCPPEGSRLSWHRQTARRVLLQIYREKTDTEAIQGLLENASHEKDEEFLKSTLK